MLRCLNLRHIPYTNPNDISLKYKLAWYVIKQTNAGVIFDMPIFANFRHIQKYAPDFEH